MLPVPETDEDFSMTVSDEATKSKFVYEDGLYPATCVDISKGVTAAGNPKLVLVFTGTAHAGPAADQDFKLHLSLSNAAQWKLLEVMAAFGIQMDPDTKNIPITRAKVVGKPVTLELQAVKKDNGKTYMEIQKVIAGAPSPTGAGVPF